MDTYGGRTMLFREDDMTAINEIISGIVVMEITQRLIADNMLESTDESNVLIREQLSNNRKALHEILSDIDISKHEDKAFFLQLCTMFSTYMDVASNSSNFLAERCKNHV